MFNPKKSVILAAILAGVVSMGNFSDVSAATASDATNSSTSKIKVENLKLVKDWDKVFPKSNAVNHRKVTFVNRYGITLAADLYEPKNYSVIITSNRNDILELVKERCTIFSFFQ